MAKPRPAITQAKKSLFLAAYADCGNLRAAARTAGIDRRSHYKWIRDDADYAQAFAEAEVEAVEALEAEARRRAVDGVEEPVFYQGVQVGAVRKHSDVLLMFLLNGALPDKYKRRYDVEQRVVTVDAIDEQIDRLRKQLGAIEVNAIEPGAPAPADSGPGSSA